MFRIPNMAVEGFVLAFPRRNDQWQPFTLPYDAVPRHNNLQQCSGLFVHQYPSLEAYYGINDQCETRRSLKLLQENPLSPVCTPKTSASTTATAS